MAIIRIDTHATDISGIVKDSLYFEHDDHPKEREISPVNKR